MFDLEKEFYAILCEFNDKDILKHFVVIGSWVLIIYKYNYSISGFQFTTSDVDFSVIKPHKISNENLPSVHKILSNLGYAPQLSCLNSSENYIPAVDNVVNNLTIEFLTEQGRFVKEPYFIKGMNIKASPLAFQDFLLKNIIKVKYHNIIVNVPAPAVWAVHKIAISQQRQGKTASLKSMKDLQGAKVILDWLGEDELLKIAQNLRGKLLSFFKRGWDKIGNGK